MKLKYLAAALLANLLCSPLASAQDVEAGGKIYNKQCRSCHGPKAQGMASFPKLAGQPADYIAMRLTQYRSGEKVGPNTPLMAPRAKKLSDEDIANISSFIATTFE
ncbi:c-type cytochrome [uncultured Roseibium sp.]|uniref:c-type cytochrome n=1 Tax=uncultured Roseibium sp. TaxID=1936171 RepID=UPI002593A1C6|nr:c-type cytochrome [uncultured Roseibium sp.]